MNKIRGFFSFVLLLLALVLAAGTLAVCSYALEAEPIILGDSGDPGARADEFMAKTFGAQPREAEEMLFSGGSLGLSGSLEDPVALLLYNALQESFDFERCSELSVNGTSASLFYRVSYLDLPSVTSAQQELTQKRLEEYLEAAERAEDVQNEDGSYRQDVAMQALEEVTAELLENAAEHYVQTQVLIELIYNGENWMIQPDSQLYRALSGNTAY